MQYRVLFTNAFKKQHKKMMHSGDIRKLEELDKVINKLSVGEILSEKYRNHRLKGEMDGKFECHILPDWLLIYQKYEDILVLELIATGTHSELF